MPLALTTTIVTATADTLRITEVRWHPEDDLITISYARLAAGAMIDVQTVGPFTGAQLNAAAGANLKAKAYSLLETALGGVTGTLT